MKHLILAVALSLSPFAVAAEDGDMAEGVDLIEEGAQMLLRGLLDEIEPQLDEFEAMASEMGPLVEMLADEMGPGFLELTRQIDSFTHYEAPEILPNGDIILRRRPDAPDWVPPEEGEIDL